MVTARNSLADPAFFWAKVEKTDGCWLWLGEQNRQGYGRTYLGGRRPMAHRVAYELVIGPIPEGLTIDHLCRVLACVNPAHLEPVTRRENILRGEGLAAIQARQTHCKRGHDEWWIRSNGARQCRECARMHNRAWRARQSRAGARAASPGPPTSSSPAAARGARAPDGMTTAPALDASEVEVARTARTGGPSSQVILGSTSTSDPHLSRWRPAFVDNDARPVPTIRKDVPIQEGVL